MLFDTVSKINLEGRTTDLRLSKNWHTDSNGNEYGTTQLQYLHQLGTQDKKQAASLWYTWVRVMYGEIFINQSEQARFPKAEGTRFLHR